MTGVMKWFDRPERGLNTHNMDAAFKDMAQKLDGWLPEGAEKTLALRNLLGARDAAIRAASERDDAMFVAPPNSALCRWYQPERP